MANVAQSDGEFGLLCSGERAKGQDMVLNKNFGYSRLVIVTGILMLAGCATPQQTSRIEATSTGLVESSSTASVLIATPTSPAASPQPTGTPSAARIILVSDTLRLSMDEANVAAFADDGSLLFLRDRSNTWYQYDIEAGALDLVTRGTNALTLSEELWAKLGAVAPWELYRQYSIDTMASRDGQLLAYIRDDKGTATLSVYSLKTGDIQDLGIAPEECSTYGNIQTDWDWAGHTFVFHCGLPARLYFGDVERSRLHSTEAYPTDLYYGLAISSAGDKVAYTANDDNWTLSVAFLDSGEVLEVSSGGIAPTWSVDGNRVYFTRSTEDPIRFDACEVYLYDLELESEVRIYPPTGGSLTDPPQAFCSTPLAVSPDERFIAFMGFGTYYILDRGAMVDSK